MFVYAAVIALVAARSLSIGLLLAAAPLLTFLIAQPVALVLVGLAVLPFGSDIARGLLSVQVSASNLLFLVAMVAVVLRFAVLGPTSRRLPRRHWSCFAPTPASLWWFWQST